MKKLIEKAKKLIDLPYNKFNLDNYKEILWKEFSDMQFNSTNQNLPIMLMSGQHENSGIVKIDTSTGGKNIYIIGKGILFDSGGMNLKPSGLPEMTNDKAGMIIALSVANYLKGNVIAYCPVTTNFIQTSKIIPGDIIKIGDKKVIVNNTDAEGRLILAEAISNLNVSKNDIIITIATLTGAVGYAVDRKATAVFGGQGLHPNSLVWDYLHATEDAKEIAWALPLFNYMQDFYKKQPFKNSENRILAGASEGAMFIKQFIKYPENWIHLDIAYSAFDSKTKKANGVPIKSLVKFIQKLNKK
jgi:leucyl aminopeptidase